MSIDPNKTKVVEQNVPKVAFNAEDAKAGLKALVPRERKVVENHISALYDTVQEAKARGVNVKEILEFLKSKGLPLSPARFKKAMAAETKRRQTKDAKPQVNAS